MGKYLDYKGLEYFWGKVKAEDAINQAITNDALSQKGGYIEYDESSQTIKLWASEEVKNIAEATPLSSINVSDFIKDVISDDVSELQDKIDTVEKYIGVLESVVGDDSTGLVKDVNELKSKTSDLVVKDVKDGDVSLADEMGVVNLSNYILNTELEAEVDKLNDAISNIKVPEYTVVEVAAGAGISKAYQLTKDGEAVGTTINIPVDMVVTDAEVVDEDDKGNEGKFIKLTIANTEKKSIYIDVTDLLNNYSAGDYIEVANNGTISVKVADLEAYFNNKYDTIGAAAAVQSNLDEYKLTNEETLKLYIQTSDLDDYIGDTLGYVKLTDIDDTYVKVTDLSSLTDEEIDDIIKNNDDDIIK